jgi:hypothetical protein
MKMIILICMSFVMAVLQLFQFNQGQIIICRRFFFNFTYVISFSFQDKMDYSLVGLPMAVTICKTENNFREQSNPSQKLLISNWDLGERRKYLDGEIGGDYMLDLVAGRGVGLLDLRDSPPACAPCPRGRPTVPIGCDDPGSG